MATDYYTHDGTPAQSSPLQSSNIRAEFDAVEAGFAKLPKFSGNAGRPLRVAGDELSVVATHNNWPVDLTQGDAVAHGGVIVSASDVTINTAVQGDVFRVYNNSGVSINLLAGSGVTLKLAGTASTGTRPLAQQGFATIWFNSSSIAIVSGPGVT